MAPGSVESSTYRSSPPPPRSNDWRMTSGASELPPIPQRITLCRPSARTSSANCVSDPHWSSIRWAIDSQPRRLPISGTPGPPQSDSSLCHTRRATSSCCACSSPLRLRLPEPLPQRLLELVGDRRVEALRATELGSLARRLDAREQLLERGDE